MGIGSRVGFVVDRGKNRGADQGHGERNDEEFSVLAEQEQSIVYENACIVAIEI